jgi:hypothetical protein
MSNLNSVPTRADYDALATKVAAERNATQRASNGRWKPTPELRYRRVNIGQPVLQQLWRDVSADSRTEWRDVLVVEV